MNTEQRMLNVTVVTKGGAYIIELDKHVSKEHITKEMLSCPLMLPLIQSLVYHATQFLIPNPHNSLLFLSARMCAEIYRSYKAVQIWR